MIDLSPPKQETLESLIAWYSYLLSKIDSVKPSVMYRVIHAFMNDTHLDGSCYQLSVLLPSSHDHLLPAISLISKLSDQLYYQNMHKIVSEDNVPSIFPKLSFKVNNTDYREIEQQILDYLLDCGQSWAYTLYTCKVDGKSSLYDVYHILDCSTMVEFALLYGHMASQLPEAARPTQN